MLKITYLSHSCFILDDGNFKILIDPFIMGNDNAPIKKEDLKVDYIVLTHAHGDHLGDAIDIAKHSDATVICQYELGLYLDEYKVKNHTMNIGGAFNFPFGRLKFTIAHHGSSTPDGRYMGEPAGVVISVGGKTIYHCGDTGLFLDMKLIGELNKINCMMAPIGDNYTMGIDDAVLAVDFVNPELVIPMHYNTFPVIKVDPQEFVNKCKMIKKNARELNFGETIELT
ncbi:MAG TPA: metal-dependent hydrolase [Candidatus Kapabacteria bacterium]|nr:metal-dependent hydrolase [Candidatus Kapabacteria bacterium]